VASAGCARKPVRPASQVVGLSEEDTGGNQVATQVSVRRYLIYLAAMIWAALARFRWRITQSDLVFHLLTVRSFRMWSIETPAKPPRNPRETPAKPPQPKPL